MIFTGFHWFSLIFIDFHRKLECDHLFPLVILCFSNFLWKSLKINENHAFCSLRRDQVEDADIAGSDPIRSHKSCENALELRRALRVCTSTPYKEFRTYYVAGCTTVSTEMVHAFVFCHWRMTSLLPGSQHYLTWFLLAPPRALPPLGPSLWYKLVIIVDYSDYTRFLSINH